MAASRHEPVPVRPVAAHWYNFSGGSESGPITNVWKSTRTRDLTWDLLNHTDLMVASGVYFYHVTTPEGREHVGKFTIVNSALAR